MSALAKTIATAHSYICLKFRVCRVRSKASRRRQKVLSSSLRGNEEEGREMPEREKRHVDIAKQTFSCRCGACRGSLSSVPKRWEVTTDVSLRSACAAAIVALVPVPAAALCWITPKTSDGSPDGPSELAALKITDTLRWVPISTGNKGDSIERGNVHEGCRASATTLWYCRGCRSRLLLTGMSGGEDPEDGRGAPGVKKNDKSVIRLFAGTLLESDDDLMRGREAHGESAEGGATGRYDQVEWLDAPSPSISEGRIGGGQGESTSMAVTAVPHWFPTAADAATPGAPFFIHATTARRHPGMGRHEKTSSTTRENPEIDESNATTTAEVTEVKNTAPGARVTFTCACGCVKLFSRLPVDQLQHCHCKMCREIHGAPFVTWAPLPESTVSWVAVDGALRAAPTSKDAVRHGCDVCGTTLSIKYHSQPDTIWLAVGAAAPGDVMPSGKGMRRILHISCSWRSSWWPVTGEERRTGIPYAG